MPRARFGTRAASATSTTRSPRRTGTPSCKREPVSTERPFAGVTVVEFGHFIAVPWAGQVLADGGAHVIKIEPLEGEPSRHIAPLGGGESRHFLIRNRGKHALPLHLKHPDAREILAALLARADVVLTNMRPGLAAELGLEYAQLRPRHPRLVFGEWLAKARTGGVPFAEQVERMPRNRVVASQAVYIRTYATKDGALAVACGSPSLRRKFIAAIGHEDPALKAAVTDVDGHYAALRVAVEATLASRTTEAWKAVLDAAGVPVSGVALPIEILEDPQPAANAMFQRFEHGTLGPVTVLGPPVPVDAGGFVPGPPTPPFGR